MPKHELKEVFSLQEEVIDLSRITDIDFTLKLAVDTESEKPKAICRVTVYPIGERVDQAAFIYMDKIKSSLVRRLSEQLGEKVLVGINETVYGHHALGFFAEGPVEEFVKYFARREQDLPKENIDVSSITFSNDPNAHAV